MRRDLSDYTKYICYRKQLTMAESTKTGSAYFVSRLALDLRQGQQYKINLYLFCNCFSMFPLSSNEYNKLQAHFFEVQV